MFSQEAKDLAGHIAGIAKVAHAGFTREGDKDGATLMWIAKYMGEAADSHRSPNKLTACLAMTQRYVYALAEKHQIMLPGSTLDRMQQLEEKVRILGTTATLLDLEQSFMRLQPEMDTMLRNAAREVLGDAEQRGAQTALFAELRSDPDAIRWAAAYLTSVMRRFK